MGLACASLASAATTPANWLNGASGNWADATKWSTNPVYPNNNSPNGLTGQAGRTLDCKAGQPLSARNTQTIGGTGEVQFPSAGAELTNPSSTTLTIAPGITFKPTGNSGGVTIGNVATNYGSIVNNG